MSDYALQLDFPPSVNTYYRRSGSRIHLSTQGARYKAAVARDIAAQLGRVDIISGRVGVSIELHCGTERLYDIDNYAKSTLDAIKGHLFTDDEQVDKLIVTRGHVEAPGHCLVIVSELS